MRLLSFLLFFGIFSNQLAAQSCPYYHTVEQGQTLYAISKKFACSIDQIKAANPGLTENIKAGSKMCIPCVDAVEKGEPEEISQEVVEQIVQVKTGKKEKYSIVFCLPFSSGESSADSLDERSRALRQVALQLYRGAMMADKKLEAIGLNAEISILDCGGSKESGDRIVKILEEKKADLIVGPLFKESLMSVIKWADKNNAHVVVPIKMSSKILLEGKNVSKVYTSAIPQWHYMVRYAMTSNAGSTVIAVYGSKDKPAADAANLGHISLSGDSLKSFNVSEGTVSLVNFVKSCTQPVVILNTCSDKKEWSTAVTALAGLDYKLVGGEGFEDGDKLSKQTRTKTAFVFSKPVLLNYNQKSDLKWIAEFRSNFKAEPNEYAVIGHDVLLYYGKAILAFGTEFQEHLNEVDGAGLVGMGFDFFRVSENAGFENSFVNVVQNNDGLWIQKNALDSKSLNFKKE